MQLTFAEEILLLALDDETGKIGHLGPQGLHYPLAGAVLMDLALRLKIDADLDKLVVVDPTPTGEALLDGPLAEIQAQYGQDTIRLRLARGAADLAGLPGIESVNDHGNFQDVRITGDPQAFLQALVQRTRVHQFEVATPSLHDIFVRIARPGPDDIHQTQGAA